MATATISSTFNSVQPALLFMPDITGFTEFVTTTEIEHAQSIIQEVLEVLIESNQLGLEVGEIEGDAVFFYRLGSAPSYNELLQQVQTMFTRFHHHLQLYEQQQICPCGACTTAAGLKLKIIAHFGDVGGYAISKYQKLFGKDVIIIHRLLKNSLNKKEYALFTHPLASSSGAPDQLPPWYVAEQAQETYDTGTIDFTIIDLAELYRQLPPVVPPQFQLSAKTKTTFIVQTTIPAPAEQVFGAIFNLTERIKWMDGVKRVEMLTKDLINRVGTRHRCIVGPTKNPVIVTEYAYINTREAELVEMDEKGLAGCRYKVQKTSDNESNVVIEMLVRNNPFVLIFFNLFMKRKLQQSITRSLDNLYHLCTG